MNTDYHDCPCKAGNCLLTQYSLQHGTIGGYNKRCRCNICLDAQHAYQKKRRAKMKEEPPGNCFCKNPKCMLDDISPQHGTANGYTSYGCRCGKCYDASRPYASAFYQAYKQKTLVEATDNFEYLRTKKIEQDIKRAETQIGRMHARTIAQRTRAKKIDRECGCITEDLMDEIWGAGICSYCEDEAVHIDHMVPLANGGWNCTTNVTPACQACNFAKHTSSIADFLYLNPFHKRPINRMVCLNAIARRKALEAETITQ